MSQSRKKLLFVLVAALALLLPPLRRALWAAYLAWRRGFWRAADERAVLTMTHALTGAERIALENHCGGAAAAIYKLKGEV